MVVAGAAVLVSVAVIVRSSGTSRRARARACFATAAPDRAAGGDRADGLA